MSKGAWIALLLVWNSLHENVTILVEIGNIFQIVCHQTCNIVCQCVRFDFLTPIVLALDTFCSAVKLWICEKRILDALAPFVHSFRDQFDKSHKLWNILIIFCKLDFHGVLVQFSPWKYSSYHQFSQCVASQWEETVLDLHTITKDHELWCAQLAKVGTQIVSELGPSGWSVVMALALLDTHCSPVARWLVRVLINTAPVLNC